MRTHFAYFVGGPWDLTKQVINHAMPTIRVAVIPRTPVRYCDEFDPNEPVVLNEVLYRAVSRCSVPNGNEVTIYQYEGSAR